MRTIATAGHVDHGKSALVRALTGTDPDRLAEEKQRGLTIELGFAFMQLEPGQTVGFVDVPGHSRFLRNMLAGAGAIDVALFVVAADEGWMPQSDEHLRILDLFGISGGVVAVTKADLAGDEAVAAAISVVRSAVAGSALGDAPIVTCDAQSGRGMDALRAAIAQVLACVPPPPDRGRPRLWIDRAFHARGAGTVVTGTLTGGGLRVGETTQLVGRAECDVRIRGLQSAHQGVDAASPGARVAVNLVGVEASHIRRGDVLVRREQWQLTEQIDGVLRLLPGIEPLDNRSHVLQGYVGSAGVTARIRAVESYARVALDRQFPLVPGDRVLLRDPGSQSLVGAVEILDVEVLGTRVEPQRLALPMLERLLASSPWRRRDDLPPLMGLTHDEMNAAVDASRAQECSVTLGNWVVATRELTDVRRSLTALVATEPVAVSTAARTVAVDVERVGLLAEHAQELAVANGFLLSSAHENAAASPAGARIVAALAESPFAPPRSATLQLDSSLRRALIAEGSVVELDGILFSAAAVDQARRLVQEELAERGELSAGDVRDLLQSSRKHAFAILTYLDREGVTRRKGEFRVAGPTVAG